WFRLFVNLTLEAMGRQQGKSATELQTIFLMDEFASTIGRLTSVNDLITQQDFIEYWADLGGCPFTEGVKKQQNRKTQNHQNQSNDHSQEKHHDKVEGMSYKEALRLFDLEDEDLTFDILKKKVRSFRSKFHPDKGEGSTPIMQQINEAYEVIRKHKGW
ncbi:MAG: J domain-containing protein, partial [Methyloprofundus sp.]|nr:J domain-containing protein [Methyloprofundus sp.]